MPFSTEFINLQQAVADTRSGVGMAVLMRASEVHKIALRSVISRLSFQDLSTVVPRDGIVPNDTVLGGLAFPDITLARRGGTIYIPPGTWSIVQGMDRASDATGRPLSSIFVPSDITLAFAPGAVLELHPGTRISILGPITASRQRIFRLIRHPSGEMPTIAFSSRHAKELYPEWWGAKDTEDGDDALPIQQAIAAAVESPMAPLSVVLSDTYQLRSPIRIQSDGGFVLRSEQLGRAKLLWDPDVRSEGAMLSFNPCLGFDCDGIEFDGSQRARTCVEVRANPRETGDPTSGSIGTNRNARFSNCTFSGARLHLVHVGQNTVVDPRIPGIGRASRTRPEDDLPGLSFEQCKFSVSQLNGFGVQLRASNAIAVHFTGCRFQGTAAAMIRAFSGSFVVRGCWFANESSPASVVPVRGLNDDAIEGGAGREFLGGIDILLDIEPPTFRDSIDMATCSLYGCVSESAIFLATPNYEFRGEVVANQNFQVLLSGIRHQPSARLTGAASLVWDVVSLAGVGFRTTTALNILGCQFGGAVLLGPQLRTAIVAEGIPTVRGAIVDLFNLFDLDPPTRGTSGFDVVQFEPPLKSYYGIRRR